MPLALVALASLFLSTPSARRATLPLCCKDDQLHISIHALREEGDGIYKQEDVAMEHFYPRPPRGGRHLILLAVDKFNGISIHALREEGDSR